MKILVTGCNTFTGANLEVGHYYNAEPINAGTSEQNKAFHALVQEYWASGAHSYNAKNFQHFRELIKLYLGAGTEKYYSLVDEQGKPTTEPKISWRIKSWANYSKKERTETIDRLISEMVQAGVDTNKFNEILRGMEHKSVGGVPA